MDTQTSGDVEIFTALEVEMRDAERCEHSWHWWRKVHHSDDSGAWLVMVFCECGEPHEMIICGKYREWVTSRNDLVVVCPDCGRSLNPAQAYRWIRKL
jgi:hypothetical protein